LGDRTINIESKESISDEFYKIKLTNKHRRNIYVLILASILSFYLKEVGYLRAIILSSLISIFIGLFITNRIFKMCKYYHYKVEKLKLPNTEPINCRELCRYYYLCKNYKTYSFPVSWSIIIFNYSILILILLAIVLNTINSYIAVQYALLVGLLAILIFSPVIFNDVMNNRREILNNCRNYFFLENKKDVLRYHSQN
jgi:hypothetical protein